jgi:hypothetical protein
MGVTGDISLDATVDNINVYSVMYQTGRLYSPAYDERSDENARGVIGGMFGKIYPTNAVSISNSSVDTNIFGNGYYHSGMIGRLENSGIPVDQHTDATFNNVSLSGNIVGGYFLGGFVGYMPRRFHSTVFMGCYTEYRCNGKKGGGGDSGCKNVTVCRYYEYWQSKLVFNNAISYMNIYGASNYVGGFVGYEDSHAYGGVYLYNSRMSGDIVTGSSNVGGVTGYIVGANTSPIRGRNVEVAHNSSYNEYYTGPWVDTQMYADANSSSSPRIYGSPSGCYLGGNSDYVAQRIYGKSTCNSGAGGFGEEQADIDAYASELQQEIIDEIQEYLDAQENVTDEDGNPVLDQLDDRFYECFDDFKDAIFTGLSSKNDVEYDLGELKNMLNNFKYVVAGSSDADLLVQNYNSNLSSYASNF